MLLYLGIRFPNLVDNNSRFVKQMTKKNSIENLLTELELCTKFVSHNLVRKTEFVENNLKFEYEMTMVND